MHAYVAIVGHGTYYNVHFLLIFSVTYIKYAVYQRTNLSHCRRLTTVERCVLRRIGHYCYFISALCSEITISGYCADSFAVDLRFTGMGPLSQQSSVELRLL